MAIEIAVCVGSSCHVRGSRDILKRFVEVIEATNLEDEVSLIGSFCMERCGEGTNWKFDGEDITSTSVDEAEKTLRSKLAEAGKGAVE